MRKHSFVDKHPVLAPILIGFGMLLLINIIVSIPVAVLQFYTGKDTPFLSMLFTILAAVIVLLIYKKHFALEYSGVIRKEGLKEGLLMCLPFIVYWFLTSIPAIIEGSFAVKPLTMTIISSSVMAGVTEEVAFRHGMITTMQRNRNQADKIISTLLISSLVFGLIHLLNIVSGADILHTFYQVLSASCLGIIMGAIFISCGNLLPVMIVHAAHDIFAIATSPATTESGIVTGSIGPGQLLDLACCLALAALGLFCYLAKNRRETIVSLWNKIWNKEAQDEE